MQLSQEDLRPVSAPAAPALPLIRPNAGTGTALSSSPEGSLNLQPLSVRRQSSWGTGRYSLTLVGGYAALSMRVAISVRLLLLECEEVFR